MAAFFLWLMAASTYLLASCQNEGHNRQSPAAT